MGRYSFQSFCVHLFAWGGGELALSSDALCVCGGGGGSYMHMLKLVHIWGMCLAPFLLSCVGFRGSCVPSHRAPAPAPLSEGILVSLTYRLFTTRNNILLCFLFWITGLTISLPGLVGWTDNVYDHKMLECIWNRTHSLSYTIFFSSCVVFLPIFVISFHI